MIPLSLAMSLVFIDVQTIADGEITAGGSIDLIADAYSNVTTISQEDPPKEMLTVIGCSHACVCAAYNEEEPEEESPPDKIVKGFCNADG